MTSRAAPKPAPNLKFAHIGLVVSEIDVMTRFYVDVLGFTITDSGVFGEMRVAFLSRDPEEHHQIVLTTGRPADLPANTINPDFGPVIQQISFKMGSLADLRDMKGRLEQGGATRLTSASHGNAWSLYAHDPEDNYIEFYVDTDWYASQPFYVPLDLTRSDEDIVEETRALCEASPGFKPIGRWRADIARAMAPPFQK
ncbi:VOC family protein [Sphingomonas sp. MG17]|uniref:VOC family protein n=1 Tax=Sphingomonas tagetis TaxID=2949092 RepID=A0A9X2KME0_9SPHN|nr:VOC family protein [Sphingomonas tagetis]MCP3731381.1 VOC family protein [Sphingomonas tagetis]